MDHRFLENIENYLDGSITLETLKEIAKEEGVTNLDEEIKWFRNATLAIEAEGLRSQLDDLYKNSTLNINENSKADPQGGRVIKFFRNNLMSMSIAASLILVLGLFFVLRPSQNTQLYSQYEYVDPGIPVLMSETDRYELYDALTYYSEENYTEAVRKLQSLEYSNATFKDTAEFYLAASYLYSGSIKECIPLFESVSEMPSSAFNERAEWLKALAILKSGNTKELIPQLDKITSKPEHAFYKQARSLADQISS